MDCFCIENILWQDMMHELKKKSFRLYSTQYNIMRVRMGGWGVWYSLFIKNLAHYSLIKILGYSLK